MVFRLLPDLQWSTSQIVKLLFGGFPLELVQGESKGISQDFALELYCEASKVKVYLSLAA